MDIHYALVLYHTYESLVEFMNLSMSSFKFSNHALQVIWFDVLCKLRQSSEERVQSLFIFEALASVVSELIVEIMTVTD